MAAIVVMVAVVMVVVVVMMMVVNEPTGFCEPAQSKRASKISR